MLGESVKFDASASRCSYSDQPIPLGSAPRKIREAAEGAGVDAVAELYNEALRYAEEGHYKAARERAEILIAIAPEDGEARLLLAQILVAGQRWKEALAALDEASTCGQAVPMSLRTAVEEHLRADQASDDEQRAARSAREQGEIKALRQEARRLRSENAQLLGENRDLEREVKKWAWTTAAASTGAVVVILASLIFSGGSSADPTPALEGPSSGVYAGLNHTVRDDGASGGTVVVETEAPTAAPAPAVAPPPSASLSDRATRALQGARSLEGTALTVELVGSTARIKGKVVAYAQRTTAERVLLDVNGIDSVDASRVEITARTKGTTHVVRSGDVLTKVSRYYYGESTMYDRIKKANVAVLKGSDALSIGQELVIPPVE